MKVIGVIPARWDSVRFPGKPIIDIRGRPMIQWVWEAASRVKSIDRVIIATDDERIYKAAKGFRAEVMMTSPGHLSGSDRTSEVARSHPADIYVNIQGDEPLISPDSIEAAIEPLKQDRNIMMGTLKTDIDSVFELFNPNVVKVVTDSKGFALYFSRLPIPYAREEGVIGMNFCPAIAENKELLDQYFKQIGLYVFRREFLFRFTSLPPSQLEKIERLEQLRALENGFRIKVAYTDKSSEGVDSPADLDKILKMINKGENGH
jgi:3-deoxy-manno-octulosonate cytidylyltransferase (CMP-KDO synthetase)